jgi:hypothetical protein
MKADKNYSMSKTTKTYLNMLMDDEKRADHKKLFVEAEYHALNARKKMSVKVINETDSEE